MGSRVFVVPQDGLRPLLDDYLGGRISDPSDPRGTGMQGAYPGIWDRAPYALPRLLYARVGLYRTIVDKPAEDIWSAGWEVVADDPKVVELVKRLDTQKRVEIKKALRTATKWARRDGWALVYYRLKDATGDPALPPAGVRAVTRASPLPRSAVEKIEYDTDPQSDTFEEPLYYHIRPGRDAVEYGPVVGQTFTITPTRRDETIRVHRDRILHVVQHPKDANPWDGDSVLSWQIGDAQGLENVKWYGAEGFAQRSVPFLKVTIDPDVPVDPDNSADKKKLDDLDKNVEDLQAGVVQKIRLQGAKIEPILGAERINPPDPYARMFFEGTVAGARMPQHEINGSAAGTISSATWDVKRYFKFIANDQEDFAAPIVREHYDRLDRWGLVPGLMAKLRGIHWFPHLELTEKERADVLDVTARAMYTFRQARVPIPEEVGKLVTWPEGFDPSTLQPLPDPAAPFQVPPPARQEGDARATTPRLRRDLRIEVSPKLRKIEDALAAAVLKEVRKWEDQVLDLFFQKTDGDRARRGNVWERDEPRADAPVPEELREALANLAFDPEGLEVVLGDYLLEAGDLGLQKTWKDLGREGKILEFVKSGRAPVIKQFARELSAAKAQQATDRVREVVAKTLEDGGGIKELREGLRDQFGVLENEATIARSEAMRGYNNGAIAAMREANVRRWQFGAYAGADEECQQRDGQVYDVADTQSLPPVHPNCRCIPIPIVEEVA